jgi:hypothetical protein
MDTRRMVPLSGIAVASIVGLMSTVALTFPLRIGWHKMTKASTGACTLDTILENSRGANGCSGMRPRLTLYHYVIWWCFVTLFTCFRLYYFLYLLYVFV